jgi:phospholipid-binding lipoprotein MlaA
MIDQSLLKNVTRVLGAVVVLGFMSGCAATPTDPEELAEYNEANDPIEPINREIFDFNNWVDRNAIKPVAIAYRDTVPEGVRDSSQNFINNIRSPVIFANDVLQGESGRPAGRIGTGSGNADAFRRQQHRRVRWLFRCRWRDGPGAP